MVNKYSSTDIVLVLDVKTPIVCNWTSCDMRNKCWS